MLILAIDPGNIESAYCLIDVKTYTPVKFGKLPNNDIMNIIEKEQYSKLVVEMVACYGMPVGATVFDTCVWIGRFIQKSLDYVKPNDISFIYRKEEKMNLCKCMNAKDSNIRQALIDRFGDVGTKKQPGWFYGFKQDIWAAYAVGVTFLDKNKNYVYVG